ncbi:MAG: S-layer homology domain-containing protein [Oscillospiraceae bacterium]|nr:S-layer homology domain-containing protein [Oscillospiraceae bacterium]
MKRKPIAGKLKRSILLALVFVLLFSVLMPMAGASSSWRAVPSSNPFVDVQTNQWHHNYVSWAWINGVTTGTSQITFNPNSNVTRGEFATFLWRIAGRPHANPSHRFTDVPAGRFFSTPIAWAQLNNIVQGLNPTTFAPNSPITREQLAAMLFRYIRYIGGDTSSSPGATDRYNDARNISSWAREYMNWAAHKGILGVGTSSLNPMGNAHRSHTVATLSRVVNMFGIEAENLPQTPQSPFEIPWHIRWGEQTFIHVTEYRTIETKYYIAHLEPGFIYSSWLFPFFDYIIDIVHDFTGLYLPDSGEKFNLYFAQDNPARNIWAPSARRNRDTGKLEMFLNDVIVGVDSRGWIDNDFNTGAASRLIYEGSHEFAHILDIALINDSPNRWSWIHGEGFATFVSSYLHEYLNPDAGTVEDFPLSVNFNLDLLRDLIHNRLEYVLRLDGGTNEFNGRTPGSIFYLYIYEEFGMEKVIEVFSVMVNCPSGSRVAIANNILGVNITRTFPAWYDTNVHRISGRYI